MNSLGNTPAATLPTPALRAGAVAGPAAFTPAGVETATGLLARLQAGGVQLCLRNGRLAVQPPRAYAALSDADRAALRTYRHELNALLRDGVSATPIAEREPEPEPTPASEPTPTTAIVSPEEFALFGLTEWHGVVTHPLGDEFAQRVLRGDVARADAIEVAQTAARDLDSLRCRGARR